MAYNFVIKIHPSVVYMQIMEVQKIKVLDVTTYEDGFHLCTN